jgi:hypothetical protein
MTPHPRRRPDRSELFRRTRAGNRGQALVEFAIILPVLLLLTVGVIDAARIFGAWISITNAVREGALYASTGNNVTHWCDTSPSPAIACPAGAVDGTVDTDGDGVIECDETIASHPIGIKCPYPHSIAALIGLETADLDQTRITLQAPSCAGGADCADAASTSVTVVASYRMDMIMPVIGDIFGRPLTMTAAATAPILR